ncbi:MAG TPA: hypothetical protein EYP61_09315 [Candidatus Latescibacteria bacterium]|nr:hypothetical protein [Candidatus Latescibacterota bacterium]
MKVPLKKPNPDSERFIRCLLGEGVPERPPLVEYTVDHVVMKPIVTELMGREWAEPEDSQAVYWDNVIDFWYRMGYDFVRMELSLPFRRNFLLAPDTAPQAEGDRSWADEHRGTITTWEDFERYDWPSVDEADFFPYEYVDSHLPEGMGLMVSHGGGMCEHLTWIMSYEGLCFALYDSPELVQAICERLGSLMEAYYERLLELEHLIAIFPGDDMGFRTGTLISPEHLREYILPWHRKFSDMAHERGIPYFLHSCGNVEAVMEDLIGYVGIDGKHSFEDAIMPAWKFHEKYGDRIATLGGVDVHVLSYSDEDGVRRYVRKLIDTCAPKGMFAVGSGNSIPSYVPVENYLAMLDEALS